MVTRADQKDQVYLSLAIDAADLSTCPDGQVGAVVIASDGTVAAIAFNGAPRGLPHCSEAGCLRVNGRCVRTIHAETNAVLWADRTRLVGATVYITRRPCYNCANLLIQAGIRELVWLYLPGKLLDSNTEALLFAAQVKYRIL